MSKEAGGGAYLVDQLSDKDRERLSTWTRSGKAEQRLVLRARIVLSAARSARNLDIAHELGTREATVSKSRFHQVGLKGLRDKPRSGKPSKYTPSTEKSILAALDKPPPKGYATWTGPLLAEKLGISEHYVWRILRKHQISLARRRSWCISTDPEFVPKAAAIVGMYSGSARECRRSLRRREARNPGAATRPGMAQTAQWQSSDGFQPRV